MPTPTLGNVAVDDLFYVTFKGRLFSQRIINTFYYSVFQIAPVDVTRWSAYSKLRDALSGAGGVKEKFLACCGPQYELEAMRLQVLRPERYAYREFAEGAVGTHAGQADTANLAASIERRCELAQRHGVGRLQIAGTPTGQENAGTWAPAYMTILNTLATEMTQDVLSPDLIGWHPSLAYNDGLVPPTWTSSPVIGAEAKNTIRVMRRRTVGVGE